MEQLHNRETENKQIDQWCKNCFYRQTSDVALQNTQVLVFTSMCLEGWCRVECGRGVSGGN